MSTIILLSRRALELLGEVECASGRPALSLPHLMESLALCHTHHLSPFTTQLWLAQAQVRTMDMWQYGAFLLL